MTSYTIAVGQNPNTVLAAAVAGDVVTFASGVHDDFAVLVSCSGNATTPIEVRGEPGAIIRHPDGVTGTGYALTVTGDYLYIHDLICENAAKVVVLEGATHVKLQRIEGRNSGDEAFKIRDASSYIYVEDCTAHDTGLDSTFGEGFYVGSASSNWPNDSSPDLTHHIRLDNCYSYRCSTDGFDAKEGASDIVVKNHRVDHTLGNAPTVGAANGDSGYYSRADRIQFINCTVVTSSGISEYGFKCYDVVVGSTTYGRNQYVKGGSSTGHALGGVGSQSDAPNGMHVYSDFTATAPRIDEVGGAWDPDYSNLNPATFTEYSWSSPAAAYGAAAGGATVTAPTPRAVGALAAVATNTVTPSLPAGMSPTDYVIVQCFSYSGGTITPPAATPAWTQLGSLTNGGSHRIFGRPYQAGDGNPTFSGGGTSGFYAATCAWQNVDLDDPLAGTVATNTGTASTTNPGPHTSTAASVDADTDHATAAWFLAIRDNVPMSPVTAGATEAYGGAAYSSTVQSDGSLSCAYKELPDESVASGTCAFERNGTDPGGETSTSMAYSTFTVPLKPRPVPDPTPGWWDFF